MCLSVLQVQVKMQKSITLSWLYNFVTCKKCCCNVSQKTLHRSVSMSFDRSEDKRKRLRPLRRCKNSNKKQGCNIGSKHPSSSSPATFCTSQVEALSVPNVSSLSTGNQTSCREVYGDDLAHYERQEAGGGDPCYVTTTRIDNVWIRSSHGSSQSLNDISTLDLEPEILEQNLDQLSVVGFIILFILT